MEAAARFPKLRVLSDNYFVAGQAVALAKGDPARLGALNKLLGEVLATGFVKASIDRAGLQGVEAAQPLRAALAPGLSELRSRRRLLRPHSTRRDVGSRIVFGAHRDSRHAPQQGDLSGVREGVRDRALKQLLRLRCAQSVRPRFVDPKPRWPGRSGRFPAPTRATPSRAIPSGLPLAPEPNPSGRRYAPGSLPACACPRRRGSRETPRACRAILYPDDRPAWLMRDGSADSCLTSSHLEPVRLAAGVRLRIQRQETI